MSNRYIGGLIYNPPGGWSGQFGATSTDYVSTASNSAFAFGTGDFTMEAFVLANTSQTDNWIIGLYNNCWLRIGASGVLEFYNSVASSSVAATSAMPINQWVHVAAVRSGTTLTIYQNGVAVASGTVSTNFSTSVACIVGNQGSGFDRRWNGYISNVRVVKGTAVYTSAFTPPNGPLQAITNTSLLTCRYPTFVDGSSNAFSLTASGSVSVNTANPFPLTTTPNPALGGAGNGVFTLSQYQQLKAQGLWPAIDPFYKNVVLNLHGNGTNGGQNNTFLDSSSNNFSITRNGNATQGTFGPYGVCWSNYFDGTANSYLRFTDAGSVLDLPGDFTAEFWAYQPAYATLNGTVNIFVSVDTLDRFQIFQESNGFKFSLNGGVLITSSFVPSLNTWNHFAITRSGTSVTMWINGVSAGTATSSYSMACASMMIGGQDRSGVYNSCNAYISNFRLVKGTALYSSAFTPSTTPLTAVSGTSLLTCQSNRFVDNSGNALSVATGSAQKVQVFSPFNPPIPYDASWAGGSGYFDGSGDYLSRTNDSAFAFGTGDFTVECWINTTSSNVGLAETSGGSTGYWMWHINGSTGNMAWQNSRGTNNLLLIGGASTALCNGAWHHLAIVRNSGTTKAYWDGVEKASAADTTNYNGTGGNLNVGYESAAGLYLTGNMAGFRIVKGTAVYTAAFTPPTAPPTAITNTSLLLNFTNASIVDNSMMNDLETVGNAQISTSVKKYGTGSIAFDGSGDYLLTQNGSLFNLGSGPWTVEGWFYTNSRVGDMRYVTIEGSAIVGIICGGGGSGGATNDLVVNQFGAGDRIRATNVLSDGVWNFIALVYDGTNTKLYLNGTQVGSSYAGNVYPNSNSFVTVGASISYGAQNYNGYIDDLRITKGVARYITNFTPPTSQVQDM